MSQAGIVIVACVSCYLCGMAIGAWLRREERADQVRALTSRNEDLALALKHANEDLRISDDEIGKLMRKMQKQQHVIDDAKAWGAAILEGINDVEAERERQ